nr:hypothetical protein [Tanacetum cinerariifolium]
MPPKRRSQTNPQPTLTQEAINQLVLDGIEAAIRDERERVRREATRAGGPAGGPAARPLAQECSFIGFMKCGPTQFHSTEGAVRLVRWFEKLENTFEISHEVANGRPWTEVKQMMTDEFCLTEEVQRLEDELRHLKLRDMNIVAYTERFNELALLCPDAIPNEKKKVEVYIKGLLEIIKGETNSSRPVTLNEAVRVAHALMEQKIQGKNKRIAKGLKRKWENNNQGNNNNTNIHNRGTNQTGIAPKCNCGGRCHFDQCPSKYENCRRMRHKEKDCRSKNVASGAAVQPNVVCYKCVERGHKIYECPKRTYRRGRNAQGQAYIVRDAEHNQGPNVVTSTFLLNNRYATMLFDFGVDKSFVDIKFSHLIDSKPVGMDWLVERDALIVYGKKEVHVPYKNKMLVVKSDSGVSRLKVISCIKARKYIERGSQLFIAQVTEKEPATKQLQGVNFSEVFPDDLPGLPPPRQVKFKIELILGAAPVARAPYRLAPSELKKLSNQLKELSEKGFIPPSSSP